MADHNDIIRPAPDQTVLGAPVRPVPPSSENSNETLRNEGAVACLSRKLRVINNACDPLNDYIKFRQYMTPEIRVITDINQWVMFIALAKIAIKSYIDYEYMDIKDHPQTLKTAMEKAYNGIDSVGNSFISSMTEIISIMQSRTSESKHTTHPNIVSATDLRSSSDTSPSVSDSSLNIISSMTPDRLP